MNILFKPVTVPCNALSIGFHVKLLDMGWEFEQALTVGEDGTGFKTLNVSLVEADHAKHGWNVFG